MNEKKLKQGTLRVTCLYEIKSSMNIPFVNLCTHIVLRCNCAPLFLAVDARYNKKAPLYICSSKKAN